MRPVATAALIAVDTRYRFEAKVAKIIRPLIPVIILCRDFATNRSDFVNVATSALVESESKASTPSSHSLAIF